MFRDKCWVLSWGNVVGACDQSCGSDMGGSFKPGDRGFAPDCHDKFRCIPSGTSSDNIRAFADGLRAGGFQTYLSGLGRPINFPSLSMPISLAVGDEDLFMSPGDVNRIRTECRPGLVVDSTVLIGSGHMDLVWGTDAPNALFVPLAKRLLPR